MKYLRSLGEKSAEQALAKMKEEQAAADRRQSEEEQAVANELSEALEEIEETYNVDFDKSPKVLEQFKEYITELAPRRNGEIVGFPNIPAAWKEFSAKLKQPNSRAKDFASRSVARPGDSTAAPQSEDHSWEATSKMISKLLG